MTSNESLTGKAAPGHVLDLTRRQFLFRAAALAAMTAVAVRPNGAGASIQEAGATPVADARLAGLVNLSQLLCRGKIDESRASTLLDFVTTDADLSDGLDQLLATPPVPGQPLPDGLPSVTAEVILTYWYAGTFSGLPAPDLATAYYQLTAWQAMYTFPQSTCRGFGAWSEAPRLEPIVAGS